METGKTKTELKFLAVIPHYNHNASLKQVAQGCLAQNCPVLIVDDGSTTSPEQTVEGLNVSFIRHKTNSGKGSAILTAATWARKNGFTHIITIDADAQHNPAQIPLFIQAAKQSPQALIIGVREFDESVPFSSRFGRKFGNFWVHLQTGTPVNDIQSGYRCYPLEMLKVLKVYFKRYAFEVEIVVRALWAGFKVKEVPVSVVYTKQRISHFSKFKDNLRLTLLNTYLTLRSMLPIAHRQYIKTDDGLAKQKYWQTLKDNIAQKGSTKRNALSAAWGIFCGSLGLPGLRQILLFWGAGWWNLNRLLSIGFEKFCIGPFIPALCIEAGYFMRNGHFLTQFTLDTLGKQILQRVWEWVLGSFIVAPLLAFITFITVAAAGFILQRSLND